MIPDDRLRDRSGIETKELHQRRFTVRTGQVSSTRTAADVSRLGLIRIALLSFGALMAVILASLSYLYVSYSVDLSNKHHTQGQNALWMAHQWVGEEHTPREYLDLALHLKQHDITDAFFHVGPLNPDGTIDQARYPHAARLIRNVKRYFPGLRIQAWVGQVERQGGGPLDLSDEQVRANIVSTAANFLDLGFDGIHYNIEPVYSGDGHFVDLLRSTKEMTGDRHKVLSVASDELEPCWGAERVVRLFAKQAGLWNRSYYLEVAGHVDQMAVMMYDTALPTDWLFGKLVEWETRALVDLVGDKVILFMGVPSYEDQRWTFNPRAENVQSGIRGIQKGLEHLDEQQIRNVGIAIYADWTTDQREWEVYEEEWLNVR